MIKQVLHTFLAMTLTMSGLAAEEIAQNDDSKNRIPNLDCVIQPSEIVDLGSAVPGVIETISVDRSDLVKKGSVIAELDSSVEKASLELAKARAGLNTAIKLRQQTAALGYLTLERNQALLKKSAVSRQDIDQLKTETRIASLQVRQEKENKRIAGLEAKRSTAILQRQTISSPVKGVVMERFKSVGEYVDGEPILRVAQLDPLHVEVIVPVDYLGQIVPGMQAKVTPGVGGTGTHLATVERVDRVADAASGTYGVRLSLPNPDYKIPAGLRCQMGFLPMEEKASLKLVKDDAAENIKVQVESVELPDTFIKTSALEPAESSSESTQESCYTIGPVYTEIVARELSSKLDKLSSDLVLRNERVMLNRGFLVLAANESTAKTPGLVETLLGKAGITDRYVITRGKNKNRVAVGTYFSRQSATKRQKQLAASGFETEIVTRRKKTTQYWLDISPKSGKNLKAQLLKLSVDIRPSVTVKSALCS